MDTTMKGIAFNLSKDSETIEQYIADLIRVELDKRLGVELPAEYKSRITAQTHYIDSAPPNVLTKRENEVLTLLASGYSRQEIGMALGVTHNTACTHVTNIYSKLNVSSIAEATQYAIRNRFV